jgi:hypothetical protein
MRPGAATNIRAMAMMKVSNASGMPVAMIAIPRPARNEAAAR